MYMCVYFVWWYWFDLTTRCSFLAVVFILLVWWSRGFGCLRYYNNRSWWKRALFGGCGVVVFSHQRYGTGIWRIRSDSTQSLRNRNNGHVPGTGPYKPTTSIRFSQKSICPWLISIRSDESKKRRRRRKIRPKSQIIVLVLLSSIFDIYIFFLLSKCEPATSIVGRDAIRS